MRLLTEHVAAGDSLTMAGLAAGFADSAHLSHGFRSMFGLAASQVLNGHSRVRAD
jgi:methylphosphotriester-DNA--protein-cysteine methyltransferase